MVLLPTPCFFRLWVSPPPRAGTSSQQEREDSKAPRLLLLWAPLLAANPTSSRRPNTDFLPVLPLRSTRGRPEAWSRSGALPS